MKKIMTMMGVLCMCVTSCDSIYEEAYLVEQDYKMFRQNGWADSLVYKQQFIDLYQSMTYDQQKRYKEYRKTMDTEAREAASIMEHAKQEAIQMLRE